MTSVLPRTGLAPHRRIRRLLIANRGEIALRVMRTARQMGIETVAVYSTADQDALHVAAAHQAVCIGQPAPTASYLNIDAIVQAALSTGADAVHPGYGFLSENAAFARACTEAGLIFVGPSAEAIEAMGDKATAKQFMREAGLPCVPGYEGDIQDSETLRREADVIGYPVIVKAKAGGGGRGMRAVLAREDFDQALSAARSEARNAFGDDRMLIERLVQDPRHIEIQVLVDAHGNGVHFGERDCSVQRRHQKLIEEAPAPGLTRALRDRLGEAAVKAAVQLGYTGVGTFEFLLEGTENFYFMEMNTRLQVEHPVTEAITGQDLVAWQLRVAMGEILLLQQSDVTFEGHAIEARLCAEDEAADFMPQSGTVQVWRPASDIRVDHAMRSGAEVSPFYDSMFAKLIVHGRNRDEARQKLAQALRETVAFGIATNREALLRIIEHPAFAAGEVDTGFLQQHKLNHVRGSTDDALALAMSAALLCRGDPPLQSRRTSMLFLRDGVGRTTKLMVETGLDSCRVLGDEFDQTVSLCRSAQDRLAFRVNGSEQVLYAHIAAGRVFLQWNGQSYTFDDVTYDPAQPADSSASDGRVMAPANGEVVAVMVAAGDTVAKGAPLLITEAMKMAYTHTAPVSGTIEAVAVSVNDFVATGRLLVKILPTPALEKEA